MKIDSPNNTVLVIGNGFDLNLGLKTSYTDFVNSACFKKIMPKNDLAKYLDAKHELQNWIDIEAELSNYSNRTAGFRMSPK